MRVNLIISFDEFKTKFPHFPVGKLSASPKEVPMSLTAKTMGAKCTIEFSDEQLKKSLRDKRVIHSVETSLNDLYAQLKLEDRISPKLVDKFLPNILLSPTEEDGMAGIIYYATEPEKLTEFKKKQFVLHGFTSRA